MIRNVIARVRAWYARRSDAFKAAMVTTWWSFVSMITAPTLRLLDDVQAWIEGTGSAPAFVTFGRTIAAAGTAALAGLANYMFRRARPGPVYPSPFPPPNPSDPTR